MGKKAEALHKSLTGQGLASRATGSSLVHKVAGRQAKTQEVPVRGPDFEASQQKGQACRQKLPRSNLGKWEVRPDRGEAVDLIFQQDADRLSFLVPERHRRMAASPFAFFRGAALPMAADLSTLPTTGLLVQACGDAHIANFGGYRSPESHLVFDLNDFDETTRGHWEWDVERLVASVAICGRTRGFGDKWCREAVRLAAQSYRESLAYFATLGSFDVWRAYLDVAEVLQGLADKVSKADRRQVAADLERAFSKTNERAFEKLVRMEDGQPQMVYDPPDIVPLSHFLSLDNQRRVQRSLARMLDDYRATVRPPYQELLKNYRLIGAAQKVVGVGSVGTRCWVAAFSGNQMADPLVLQIKEANASVLEQFCGRSPYLSHGERVVAGQRLMQTTSGVLLGWTHARDERGRRRDYYVRQLWNWKMSVDLDHASADELEIYSQLCAWVLARAHARTGDRVAMASYLGTSDKFDASMVSFALTYADQNESDYKQFLKRIAVR